MLVGTALCVARLAAAAWCCQYYRPMKWLDSRAAITSWLLVLCRLHAMAGKEVLDLVQLTPERLVSVFLPQQLPGSWQGRPEVPWSGQEPVSRAWIADLWRWLEVCNAPASPGALCFAQLSTSMQMGISNSMLKGNPSARQGVLQRCLCHATTCLGSCDMDVCCRGSHRRPACGGPCCLPKGGFSSARHPARAAE